MQPVPKVVRVDWFWTIANGVPAQVRKFFQYAGALSSADAQTWVNSFNSAYNTTGFQADMPATTVLNSIMLTDLTSASSPQAIASTGRTGTNGGTSVPNSIAFVVKDRIARRYRGGHPRTYLPGVPTARLSGPDTWDATNGTNLLNDWVTYINACMAAAPAGVGAVLEVNVSYFAGFTNHTFSSGRIRPLATPRAVPLIDAIVGHSFNPRVASQRRRNHQSA